MTLETILVSIGGHIATVTLARGPEGNAISEQMAFELRDACDQLDQDDEVWVVVLTGKGKAFCSGTDLSAWEHISSLETLHALKIASRAAAIKQPVIAALNGDALDQGLELALACDMRVVSRDAKLGLTQVSRGQMPWDGGTQRLPRLVGRSRAAELVLTSRVVDAQEALQIGLVNQVVDQGQALEHAQQVAATIAGHGPIAASYLKEAVLKGMDLTLEQGMRLEADLSFLLQSTSDRAEGIQSFLQRRKAKYKGR